MEVPDELLDLSTLLRETVGKGPVKPASSTHIVTVPPAQLSYLLLFPILFTSRIGQNSV